MTLWKEPDPEVELLLDCKTGKTSSNSNMLPVH